MSAPVRQQQENMSARRKKDGTMRGHVPSYALENETGRKSFSTTLQNQAGFSHSLLHFCQSYFILL